jgi:hypothetical protein
MRTPMRASARLSLPLENYQEARDAFQSAAVEPGGRHEQKQLDLSDRVLALDPNARGLRVAERYQRSKELLQAEVMRFDQCQPGSQRRTRRERPWPSQPRRMSWRIQPT